MVRTRRLALGVFHFFVLTGNGVCLFVNCVQVKKRKKRHHHSKERRQHDEDQVSSNDSSMLQCGD